MKKEHKFTVVIVATFIFMNFCFAFVVANIDFRTWASEARFFYILFSMILSWLMALVCLPYIEGE